MDKLCFLILINTNLFCFNFLKLLAVVIANKLLKHFIPIFNANGTQIYFSTYYLMIIDVV